MGPITPKFTAFGRIGVQSEPKGPICGSLGSLVPLLLALGGASGSLVLGGLGGPFSVQMGPSGKVWIS